MRTSLVRLSPISSTILFALAMGIAACGGKTADERAPDDAATPEGSTVVATPPPAPSTPAPNDAGACRFRTGKVQLEPAASNRAECRTPVQCTLLAGHGQWFSSCPAGVGSPSAVFADCDPVECACRAPSFGLWPNANFAWGLDDMRTCSYVATVSPDAP